MFYALGDHTLYSYDGKKWYRLVIDGSYADIKDAVHSEAHHMSVLITSRAVYIKKDGGHSYEKAYENFDYSLGRIAEVDGVFAVAQEGSPSSALFSIDGRTWIRSNSNTKGQDMIVSGDHKFIYRETNSGVLYFSEKQNLNAETP